MYFGYTYNYVEELKYRLGDEWYYTAAKLLHSPREYISYSCSDYPIRYHVLDHEDYDNGEWMFCSKNWSKKDLIDIYKKTNLDYESYYDTGWNLVKWSMEDEIEWKIRWNLSIWSIDDVIKWNPELCIVKTNNWHDFLRFHGVFWDSLCIVKERNKFILWIQLILLGALYVLITCLLYYKVIIYIIYGSKKSNKKAAKRK
jgi:hypothetical protein